MDLITSRTFIKYQADAQKRTSATAARTFAL